MPKKGAIRQTPIIETYPLTRPSVGDTSGGVLGGEGVPRALLVSVGVPRNPLAPESGDEGKGHGDSIKFIIL